MGLNRYPPGAIFVKRFSKIIAERLTDCPEHRSAFHRFRRKIAKRFSKIAQRFRLIAKRFVRGPIFSKESLSVSPISGKSLSGGKFVERFTDFGVIAERLHRLHR